MTKVVTFTTAVLLKEKNYNIPTLHFYSTGRKNYLLEAEDYMTERLVITNWNNGMGSYPTKVKDVACSAPTIAEVIQWLYEKHSLIILTIPTVTGHFAYKIIEVQLDPNNPIERPPYEGVSAEDYNNPWECYEAGIEYILKTLI